MIEVTVALPIKGQLDIVWLQLESLCRQEASIRWELIVSECKMREMKDLITERYVERLYGAGCRSVEVLENPTPVPLGLKWRDIAKQAQGSAMILCAADNYSYPTRIQDAHEYVNNEDYDWLDVSSGLFYDFSTGERGQWRRPTEKRSGLFMAAKTAHLQRLSADPPNVGIDGWIKEQLPPDFKWKQLPGPFAGLHTDGFNTISTTRSGMYNGSGAPNRAFRMGEPIQQLSECVPPDIERKIRDRSMRTDLGQTRPY